MNRYTILRSLLLAQFMYIITGYTMEPEPKRRKVVTGQESAQQHAVEQASILFWAAINTCNKQPLMRLKYTNEVIALLRDANLSIDVPLFSPKKDERYLAHMPMLSWAALKNTFDLVELLLDHGASALSTNSASRTPLHFACLPSDKRKSSSDQVKIIKLLIEKGASYQAYDLYGYQPLHYLAPTDRSQASAMEELIKSGAPINSFILRKGEPRDTALHSAVRCGNEEHIKVLLDHGASITIKNADGLTVVDMIALEPTPHSELIREHNLVEEWIMTGEDNDNE